MTFDKFDEVNRKAITRFLTVLQASHVYGLHALLRLSFEEGLKEGRETLAAQLSSHLNTLTGKKSVVVLESIEK